MQVEEGKKNPGPASNDNPKNPNEKTAGNPNGKQEAASTGNVAANPGEETKSKESTDPVKLNGPGPQGTPTRTVVAFVVLAAAAIAAVAAASRRS